jgi:hypothetical protein
MAFTRRFLRGITSVQIVLVVPCNSGVSRCPHVDIVVMANLMLERKSRVKFWLHRIHQNFSKSVVDNSTLSFTDFGQKFPVVASEISQQIVLKLENWDKLRKVVSFRLSFPVHGYLH